MHSFVLIMITRHVFVVVDDGIERYKYKIAMQNHFDGGGGGCIDPGNAVPFAPGNNEN